MSYAASNQRIRAREWTHDRTQVVNLARDLVKVGVLSDAETVLEYFDEPFNWNREHEWWMAHACTDNPDQWAESGML